MNLTAEQINKTCEDLTGRAYRMAVNKMFMEQDDSNLWPIRNRFNITQRAFSHARKFERDSGVELAGLEYCLFVEDDIGRIVNDSNNW